MEAHAEERRGHADDLDGKEDRADDARNAVIAGDGPQLEAVHRAASTGRPIVEAYRRDGFVKVQGVFTADELAYYREHISSEVLRRNTNTAPIDARDTYHKAFLQVTNLWRTSEAARRFVFERRLADLAAQLLGVERVRLYHDQALYKEPGGGITPWHADQFYWPLSSERTITAWVPLQATPLEMGPLAFAAGSHRLEFGRDLAISDESERSLRKALESGRFREVNEPYELGEVSFHSGWTFHHTGANASNQARAVMTVMTARGRLVVFGPARWNVQP